MIRGWRCMLLLTWIIPAVGGCVANGVYHTVRSGENLASIARTYGRNEVELARINGIASRAELRSGDRVFIPGAQSVRQETSSASVAPPSSPTSRPPPSQPAVAPASAPDRPSPSPKVASRHAPSSARQPSPTVDRTRFAWPFRGKVLRRFGDPKPFPCNGVEIAAPAGTPVRSAAAGRVIYSGNGIRSFGNLIIVKHDEDFYTVYGFNQTNLVKTGSFVSQGERLALSGVSPDQRGPRLYFEIRHHKQAVDPTFYLP